MTIGEKIKQRRIQLGMTQTELAEKMGYKSKSAVCRIETNVETNLSFERIGRFAKVLQVSPLEFMDPGADFFIRDDEKEMLIEYRAADVITRQAVNRLLSYKEGLKNEQ